MQVAQHDPWPGAWRLFRLWGSIGLQSFGGGPSTILLIRRTFTEKHSWVDEEEMARYWNLCLFTPGINLIALTILIGYKLRGVRGIIASLAGLLSPSATITCLIAAVYALIRTLPAIQAILRGIIPATAGVMLLVGLSFMQPLLIRGYKEGFFSLSGSIIIILASALLLILFKLSAVFVLLGMALLGIVLFTPRHLPIMANTPEHEETPHD